jgi:hypothetical protein
LETSEEEAGKPSPAAAAVLVELNTQLTTFSYSTYQPTSGYNKVEPKQIDEEIASKHE